MSGPLMFQIWLSTTWYLQPPVMEHVWAITVPDLVQHHEASSTSGDGTCLGQICTRSGSAPRGTFNLRWWNLSGPLLFQIWFSATRHLQQAVMEHVWAIYVPDLPQHHVAPGTTVDGTCLGHVLTSHYPLTIPTILDLCVFVIFNLCKNKILKMIFFVVVVLLPILCTKN